MSWLIPILAAISAVLLFQLVYELRERGLAAARIYGLKASRAMDAGFSLAGLRRIWADLRQTMAEALQRRLPEEFKRVLIQWLAQAGDAQSPGNFALTMLLNFFTGFSLGLILDLGLYTLACALLGLALPLIRLQDMNSRRQAALRRQLPDALDLLTSCVEAGLGFDQALARVAARLKEGTLRTELESTVAALGLGASRREALRDLESRLRLEELSQLVAALLQADKRGAPLGPALRAQSGQLRRLRTLRVKKLAAEAPLKMLFPLMVFILPVVFIVLFGPIVLKWKAGGF